MVKSTGAAEARRQAQELLSKKQSVELRSEHDKARQIEAQKTAHLRELRLAKEAEDKARKEESKRRAEMMRETVRAKTKKDQ